MTAGLLENPTELVVDDDGKTYGGFSEIARMLNAQQPDRERPYSRQLVHKWYINRGHNRFPEAHPVRTRSGRVRLMFNKNVVDDWHRIYRQTRVPRPRPTTPEIDTIPLFEVASDGKTIW